MKKKDIFLMFVFLLFFVFIFLFVFYEEKSNGYYEIMGESPVCPFIRIYDSNDGTYSGSILLKQIEIGNEDDFRKKVDENILVYNEKEDYYSIEVDCNSVVAEIIGWSIPETPYDKNKENCPFLLEVWIYEKNTKKLLGISKPEIVEMRTVLVDCNN